MDITIYLPNELGERAKREEINLSRMLRDALIGEFERRSAVEDTLDKAQTFELALENQNGDHYTGRITGARIAVGPECSVYLTDDERVIAHDEDRLDYYEMGDSDPAEWLAEWLQPGRNGFEEYMQALSTLGITPKVDL